MKGVKIGARVEMVIKEGEGRGGGGKIGRRAKMVRNEMVGCLGWPLKARR